jgi:hypothetical protein
LLPRDALILPVHQRMLQQLITQPHQIPQPTSLHTQTAKASTPFPPARKLKHSCQQLKPAAIPTCTSMRSPRRCLC